MTATAREWTRCRTFVDAASVAAPIAGASSRKFFVTVRFASEARAFTTLSTSAAHPLTPGAPIVGPLLLNVTPELIVDGPFFGSQVLERVEQGLATMGWKRTSEWEHRSDHFAAWADPCSALWPIENADEVFDLLDSGMLP